MKNHQKTFSYVLIGTIMLVAVLWSYSFMGSRQKAACGAKEDLQRSSRVIDQLRVLLQKPKLASEHERLSSETTGMIEKASRAAGIASGSILRITPQPPHRVHDTAYLEKPTGVSLKGVTLLEFLKMASRLSDDENCLDLKSVTVTSPDANDTGDKWNVELVLTYLIYDPINNQNKGVRK